MISLAAFLLILALVFFILATVGVPQHPHFAYVPAGLACLTLVLLIGHGVISWH